MLIGLNDTQSKQNKNSTKVDRKIKQTKSQFECEFKTAVIEENKLLSIIIENEYKENKGIAKFVWKSEEQISDFPWLNIEKQRRFSQSIIKNICIHSWRCN